MDLKRRISTPQKYIQVGMAFFMVGIVAYMVGDGRLIGAWLASFVHDQSVLATIRGIAIGFSIAVSCASIFFNVRGLVMMRSKSPA